MSPSLGVLRAECSALDPQKGTPIFNANFPALGRESDNGNRIQFLGSFKPDDADDEADLYDLPMLLETGESTGRRLISDTRLPLVLRSLAYVGAYDELQYLHRYFAKHFVGEG